MELPKIYIPISTIIDSFKKPSTLPVLSLIHLQQHAHNYQEAVV